MYYFVPAWYGTDRIWQQSATPWYWMRESIEFDDTINQVRIFQEAEMDRVLLLPQYNPQLRYFLHRQDILETDVISIFDGIQGVPSDLPMRPIQLQDMQWPSGTIFSYTPFLAIAFRKGKCLAKIDMGVDGNILSLTRYKDEEIIYIDYMDDRGFISSRLYYNEGKPYFHEYLRFDGQWILREMLIEENRSVMVNEAFFHAFKKESYANIGEVVSEKMKEHLMALIPGRDQLVLAAHPANLAFLQDTASGVKKVLSFYGDRQPLSAENFVLYFDMIDAQLLITDSEKTKEAISVFSPSLAQKTHRITSFDSRLRLGSSQERKESKIYYYIKENELPTKNQLKKILEVLGQHPLFEVVFAFYNGAPERVKEVEQQLEELISSEQNLNLVQSPAQLEVLGENQIIDKEFVQDAPDYRFVVKNFSNENDIIQELEKTRLIVDLSEEPNLYTQIAGISAGIPQVNRVQTEYVDHLKNGYVLSKGDKELEKAITHFLLELKPWNEALVYSIEKIQEYTGQRLIEKWEGWMKERHG